MPEYDGAMIGGPWNGRMVPLSEEALKSGRFQPDSFEGEYVREAGVPDWLWSASQIRVTESGATKELAREAADREARVRYGTSELPSAEVIHEMSSGQIDADGEIVGEPIMWTVQVQYG